MIEVKKRYEAGPSELNPEPFPTPLPPVDVLLETSLSSEALAEDFPEKAMLHSVSSHRASLDSQHSEKMHFVEELGLMFEQVGLPRMAGRILGWLLISSPAHQSSADLAEVLQASKGSISSITRLLIQIGLIERTILPGDRRDYFQIKPNAWTQMTEQRLAQITHFRQLAEKGLNLITEQPLHLQHRLQEMRDFHAFWERELPLLNQRWQREKGMRDEG